MRQYLETMGVDELAIQANEKGEAEHDTYHTVELTDRTVKITKRSRVNNDLVVELTLGEPLVEYLPPSHNTLRKHLLLQYLLYVRNGVLVDSIHPHVDSLRFNVYVDVSCELALRFTTVFIECNRCQISSQYYFEII
jgi:hypothetical protein